MSPRIQPARLRAVLWDVFGTLVVSRAAEPIERDRPNGCSAIKAAVVAAGLPVPDQPTAERLLRRLQNAVRLSRAALRRRGEPCPEPDVRTAWRSVLRKSAPHRPPPTLAQAECAAETWERLTNPVGPMPGAHKVLRELTRAGIVLGIASNAQFDTPDRLAALFGDAARWEDDLCVWSWRIGAAKPSPTFYENVLRRIAARGWHPRDVLMVGNHPLNDIVPAQRAGLRTAWLRDPDSPSAHDANVERLGRTADYVLHSLEELLRVLRPGR